MTPLQDPLFHANVYDALKAIVERIENGNQIVGHRLRPNKTVPEAGKWLADCLNPLRNDKLDPEDVIAILRVGREIGYHGAMVYVAGECGYAAQPIEPQDEQAALMRDYIESVKQSQRIAQRLERLATGPSLSKVA